MNTASYREYVHLYAEGCLPDYAEATLFAELSHNGDLRAELTEQIKLLATARHHAASIHAAPQSKNALFAELGLALPGESASIRAASGIVSGTSATGGIKGMIAAHPRMFALSASVISSLATIVVMLFWAKQSPAPEAIASTTTALSLAPTSAWSANGSSQRTRFGTDFIAPVRTSVRTPVFESIPSGLPMEAASYFASDNTLFDSNNGIVKNDIEASNDAASDEYLEVNPSTPFTIQEETIQPETAQKETIQEKTTLRPNLAPLQATAVVSQLETLPVRLSLRHALGMGETGIHVGLHYTLTKQHAIGFEGGMERAALLTKSSGGDINTSSPEGGVFSGTAFYRYSFTGLAFPATRQIVPFAQAGLGVIGRCGAVQGMVGVRFDVMPELSFTMAAEAKLPVLYAQNYFQSKTALSVGIQYHISGD